ncbi:MAG: FHA domain-containing protein [Lentisphaeria bacterium]|nr:FHA domain-containing protein [Lentisphaeria bacterium]
MILQFLNGDRSGEKKEVSQNGLSIGRETDNDVQLLIGGVSRYHAKVEWKNEQWQIRDLGSTNGTKLNGTLVLEPTQLHNGDVISIGEQMFRIDGIAEQKQETQSPSFVFRPPESQTVRITQPEAEKQPAPAPQKQEETPAPKSENYTELPSSNSIFGKKKSAGDTTDSRKQLERSGSKSILSTNALFYVLVIMIGIFCVALFWKFQAGNNQKNNQAGNQSNSNIIRNPFMLYYEKFSISKENSVFKFKLLLENNQIKFSLDDLQSGRVYAPVINEKLSDAAINKLKMAIEDTNFMTSRQQESIDMEEENNRNFTRLIIGYDDKFNDLTVKDIPLASFSKVEQAITDFLQEEVGLDPSMSESKEVLLREAKERFDRAENQFNSYKNQPGNLWRSIENYKIAMKRYEVFADKPQEWKIARERYNKAQAILEKIRKDGNVRVNLLCQQREYRRALEECTRLMDFFPETSTTYKKIRNTKLQIEKIISGDKK